jgi:hypothetical protein
MGTGSSPSLDEGATKIAFAFFEDFGFSSSIFACFPYFEKQKEAYEITLLSVSVFHPITFDAYDITSLSVCPCIPRNFQFFYGTCHIKRM